MVTLFAFLFLGASFFSLWFKREPKIWGSLLFLSLLCGIIAGNILWIGLLFIIALLLLWLLYNRQPSLGLFLAIICLSSAFKLHFLPGYQPFGFTPKFAVGLENPLIGLFPLALLVSLARNVEDWKGVLKGLAMGCVGILIIACFAAFSGVVHLQFKLLPFIGVRTLSNLVLTSIPEEGFYRGFVQKTLCDYFNNKTTGKIAAVLLTSSLFTAHHIFWSPNVGILVFTFLASLLYGIIYLLSKRIESAMLSHFLLNLIHMTLFAYHSA